METWEKTVLECRVADTHGCVQMLYKLWKQSAQFSEEPPSDSGQGRSDISVENMGMGTLPLHRTHQAHTSWEAKALRMAWEKSEAHRE